MIIFKLIGWRIFLRCVVSVCVCFAFHFIHFSSSIWSSRFLQRTELKNKIQWKKKQKMKTKTKQQEMIICNLLYKIYMQIFIIWMRMMTGSVLHSSILRCAMHTKCRCNNVMSFIAMQLNNSDARVRTNSTNQTEVDEFGRQRCHTICAVWYFFYAICQLFDWFFGVKRSVTISFVVCFNMVFILFLSHSHSYFLINNLDQHWKKNQT